MKIINILVATLLALPFAASAQDVPNGGFEQTWINCVPWTSNGNTKDNGITPESWTISNVIGMNGVGATSVGGQTTGCDSENGVLVLNSPNSILASQIVPGYITLGTTWNTSVMGKQNDGGTFGGIDFTGRPEKITFSYRRTLAQDSNTQPATAVAYLWKGTYTQTEVPGNISAIATGLVKVDMVDRDRAILGIETATGGAVTKSDDAELIAKGITKITEVTNDWVNGEIVLEYYSDATPEKLNVIFAANDYFGAPEIIEKDNTLSIDNVKCVYAAEPDPKPAGESVNYVGKLIVEMLGDELNQPGGDDATVTITPTGDNTCSFLLPDLTLGDIGVVGDIYLKTVNTEVKDGVTNYSATVKDFSLLDGNIICDLTLQGTTNQDGDAAMQIAVVWQDIPINVTFNGKKEGASVALPSADNASVELYTVNGVRVNDGTTRPGLYIRRQGNNVTKIVIR